MISMSEKLKLESGKLGYGTLVVTVRLARAYYAGSKDYTSLVLMLQRLMQKVPFSNLMPFFESSKQAEKEGFVAVTEALDLANGNGNLVFFQRVMEDLDDSDDHIQKILVLEGTLKEPLLSIWRSEPEK